jgi:hypothetical protein
LNTPGSLLRDPAKKLDHQGIHRIGLLEVTEVPAPRQLLISAIRDVLGHFAAKIWRDYKVILEANDETAGPDLKVFL